MINSFFIRTDSFENLDEAFRGDSLSLLPVNCHSYFSSLCSFLQNHDARIIVAACYEDKARLLLCAVSSFKYLNGSDRAIKHLAHLPTHA